LRNAAARTFDALIHAIARALEAFTTTNAQTKDIHANRENALEIGKVQVKGDVELSCRDGVPIRLQVDRVTVMDWRQEFQ
jgi:hypothetical protein